MHTNKNHTISNDLKQLSDKALLVETRNASRAEKEATLKLLTYLDEVNTRRLYAIEGYASLYEFTHKGLGYSESQATERVNAVRLMKKSTSVKAHLDSGSLTLSTASQIQRFLTLEGKHTGQVPVAKRDAIISECLNLSKREAERVLNKHASVATKRSLKERIRAVGVEHLELKIVLSKESAVKFNRAKELVAYKSLEDLFSKALTVLIEKEERRLGKTGDESTLPATLKDEQGPKASAPIQLSTEPKTPSGRPVSRSRYIPVPYRRAIYSRSGGQCEWRHPDTNIRCQSRSHLNVDHIKPLALGGLTEFQNLRHLCASHNWRAAIEAGIAVEINSDRIEEERFLNSVQEFAEKSTKPPQSMQ